MEELVINGKKVHIYDDAIPAAALSKWYDFYTHKAEFAYNRLQNADINDTHFLQCQLNFKKSVEVFGIYDWLPEKLKNFDPNCTFKHYHASYINMLLKDDVFTAHSDIKEIPEGKFYIGCIWFGNPFEPNHPCGFQFENKVVNYKFNRLILFDGSLWHQPQAPLDDYVRLSYYISFTNAYDYKVDADKANKCNPWYRKIQNNRNPI